MVREEVEEEKVEDDGSCRRPRRRKESQKKTKQKNLVTSEAKKFFLKYKIVKGQPACTCRERSNSFFKRQKSWLAAMATSQKI